MSMSLAKTMYNPGMPQGWGGWNGDFKGLPQTPTMQGKRELMNKCKSAIANFSGNDFAFKPYGLPPRRYDNIDSKQAQMYPMERRQRRYLLKDI